LAQTKLFLIEGLPGSGKSTTAGLVFDHLTRLGLNARVYIEGNLDHPADYDGWSYFSAGQFNLLLAEYKAFEKVLRHAAEKRLDGFLLERRKLKNFLLPEELHDLLFSHDIYELPFNIHTSLLTERWQRFAGQSAKEETVYVFDCCFIQNPVTIGMVKWGVGDKEIAAYIKMLEAIIEPLNPVLIYVDQENIRDSFGKAVKERPADWSQGFMDYYTRQGYGLKQKAGGLEGTLTVLEARRKLEAGILSELTINSHTVDNSRFEMEGFSRKIEKIINSRFEVSETKRL